MAEVLDAVDGAEERVRRSGKQDASEEKEKRKVGGASSATKKLKISLTEPDDGPLAHMMQKFKERDVKYDLSELIEEALLHVPKDWWESKLDELTPLEFKIKAALEIPELRDRLTDLLKTVP